MAAPSRELFSVILQDLLTLRNGVPRAPSLQRFLNGLLKLIPTPLCGRQALLAITLLGLSTAAAQAADQQQCYALREQRDQVAAESMRPEISLARTYRQRICPALSTKAELANAIDRSFVPIDYGALIACRRQAEAQLERSHRLLYRNRQGFGFYTPAGAALARQADQQSQDLTRAGCR